MSAPVVPRWLARVTGWWLASRVALVLVAWIATHAWDERWPNPLQDFRAFPDHPIADAFARWDSGWYARIAREGYGVPDPGGQQRTAFFPAYPYLTRWLAPLTGNNHFVAGLLLSNLSLLAAVLLLHRWVRRTHDEETADRSVGFVLAFPTTVFLSAYYPESLHLLLCTAALFAHTARHPWRAGLLAAAATLTRSSGILLVPALFLGELRAERATRRTLVPALLASLLPVLALVFHAAWLRHVTGDPLAFVHAQSGWQRSSAWPWDTLLAESQVTDWRFTSLDHGDVSRVLDLGAAVLWFAAAVWALRRLDTASAVFLLATLVVPLASGRVLSLLRFAVSAPPLFVTLAVWTRRRGLAQTAALVLAPLAGLLAGAFATWHWAG